MDKVCENCKYNEWDAKEEEFYCTNRDSVCYGMATFYEETCDEYEESEV